MNFLAESFNRKNATRLLILSILIIFSFVCCFLPINTTAAQSGRVIIYKPTTNGEYEYWNSININYRVVVYSGWEYESSVVYIDGVRKGTFSSTIVNIYISNLPIRAHTLKIEVNCVRFRPFSYEKYFTTRAFTTFSSIDEDDMQDLRINELHNLGKGGQGVTICVMGDGLGFDDAVNSDYHPMILKQYSNVYRDIEYLVFDSSTLGYKQLTSNWDQLSAAQKWSEIRDVNIGHTGYSHGTNVLSVLTQIAPHANYIFIEHKGVTTKEIAAIKWLAENNRFESYDINILSLYWSYSKSWIMSNLEMESFWGTTYNWNDFEGWFDTIAYDGDNLHKTITLSPAGEEEISPTIFTDKEDANYPTCFESVIGITGIYDGENVEQSWYKYYSANSGYGVDATSIHMQTEIAWNIIEGSSSFAGTCNAVALTTGIIALIKQLYRPVTIQQLQTTLRYTGDEMGEPPIYYGGEVSGAYSTIEIYFENGYFGPDYIGWGIIDAYESYWYVADNFIP